MQVGLAAHQTSGPSGYSTEPIIADDFLLTQHKCTAVLQMSWVYERRVKCASFFFLVMRICVHMV